MIQRGLLLTLAVLPAVLAGQQPVTPDTLHQHGDTLTGRPITLQAITVAATPSRRDEPSASIRVAPAVLQQTPAFNAYDLLRQTAGIEVHDQGQGPGFASDASVRGFSSDHSTDIALWVDGVPNNEPVNGHAEGYNDWNLLFPEAIDGVDVLKGPTSALYGNFAFSGIVSVRTLERMKGTTAWLDPGSFGHVEGGLMTGFDHDQSGGVFALRGVHEDGWRRRSNYSLGQGHARLVRTLSPTGTLDAGVELYSTKWNSPGFLPDSVFEARQFNLIANPTDGGYKNRAQERVSFRILTGAALWRTTVYATQGRWQLFLTIPPEPGSGEGTGSQTEEEDRRYGFGLTSALTWDLPRAEVTVGTEGRWDHSNYENWLTTNRVRDSAQTLVAARQLSGALFVQSTEDLGHHIRLSLGGRLDLQRAQATPTGGSSTSDGKAIFAPKLGALYHLPKIGGDLYVNVSRGFRQTDGVIEDPSLPFITAWAYETGLKIDGRYLNASLALFRMDVSNEQTFDPITAASTNGGKSRRQGVEFEFVVRPAPALSVTADWTFNDAKYKQLITADGDTLDGARVFNTAEYVGTVAIELAPPAAIWRLRVASNVLGPYAPFDEPGVELPAYGLLHVSGGIRLGAAQLELGVRNVLDRVYPELRAGAFVTPGQPRAAFGSVRYVF
jgi:iron complex outermembrane recepter protein